MAKVAETATRARVNYAPAVVISVIRYCSRHYQSVPGNTLASCIVPQPFHTATNSNGVLTKRSISDNFMNPLLSKLAFGLAHCHLCWAATETGPVDFGWQRSVGQRVGCSAHRQVKVTAAGPQMVGSTSTWAEKNVSFERIILIVKHMEVFNRVTSLNDCRTQPFKAEKNESFERINLIRVTHESFGSCNWCKWLGLSRLQELHELKVPCVLRIEFIHSKLPFFSAHVAG